MPCNNLGYIGEYSSLVPKAGNKKDEFSSSLMFYSTSVQMMVK